MSFQTVESQIRNLSSSAYLGSSSQPLRNIACIQNKYKQLHSVNTGCGHEPSCKHFRFVLRNQCAASQNVLSWKETLEAL